MGRGARFALFFLLVLPALAFAYAPPEWLTYYSPSSLSGCFPLDSPKNFWGLQSYRLQNQYISKFFVFDIYSYSFDSNEHSGNWNISLMNKTAFLSAFPPSEQGGFANASERLEGVAQTIRSSSVSASLAHNLSANSQFYNPAYTMLFKLFPPYPQNNILWVAYYAGYDYVLNYPGNFWGALSGAANAFRDANEIGRMVSAKVDGRFEKLDYMGAGAAYYHGEAKDAYLSAANLVSDAGFCGRQQKGARAVLDYFNNSPHLPQTMPSVLCSYMSFTLGAGSNSSISILSSSYISLGDAIAVMEREQATSKAKAARQLSSLNRAISAASAQDFDRMTNLPSVENSTMLSTGTLHSGLSTIIFVVQSSASNSSQLISDADLLLDEKPHGYLATAISNYESSYAKSSSAISSINLALTGAAAYESRERELAQSAISYARDMLSAPPPAATLESKAAAEKQLDAAVKLFDGALREGSIGRRYESYSKALAAAKGAVAILQGETILPLAVEAGQQLDALEKFLKAAAVDGVDVDFYLGRLATYRQDLGTTNNPALILAIENEAAENRRSVELLLQSKYSGFGEKYAELASTVSAMRAADPLFLPAFDALRAKLANGQALVLPNAGHLKEIDAAMDSLNSQISQALPAKLSQLLAANARSTSLHEPLELGKPSDYRITITARNPLNIGYSGAVAFKVPCELALYSSDSHSGDTITDASPIGARASAGGQAGYQMNEITVPSVAAKQEFNIVFEKADSPAQQTSISRSCTDATQELAEETISVDFSTNRALDALMVSSPAPVGTASATLEYDGTRYPAELRYLGDGLTAEGAIKNVQSGKNSLSFVFSVENPFALATLNRTMQNLGNGVVRTDSIAAVSSQSLECRTASVYVSEPYSGVEGYSVSSISGDTSSAGEPLEIGSGTIMGFSFSPLRTGGQQLFAMSFTVRNASQALSDALQNAEITAQMFNRTSDLDAISDAKRLAALNQTDAALAAVLAIQSSQKAISTPDYKRFLSENSSASGLLSSALVTQGSLSDKNSAAPSAQLASLTAQLQSEISKAGSLADAGKYRQAADALLSASSSFSSSLSSLAWKASSQAADDYAKARQAAQGAHAAELAEIESAVSLSQRQFSAGSALDSFTSSALAQSKLSALQALFSQDSLRAKEGIQRISSDFSALQKKAEEALSSYSAQYAALTAQSKRMLPITPADAQKALQDAIKGMEKAAAAKDPAGATLAAANGSYSSLFSLLGKLDEAAASLESSARSSLALAKAGLSEAKQKASGPDSGDISAIEKEVGRADGMLADSLYSDSIASSDRALSAASLFVQKKAASQGGFEPKTILLGVVSILFICAAAYYFWQSKSSGSMAKPEGKKEIPKAE